MDSISLYKLFYEMKKTMRLLEFSFVFFNPRLYL